MTMSPDERRSPQCPPVSAMTVVGVILAQGTIRLIDRRNYLARLTKERVSTDVLTSQGESRE